MQVKKFKLINDGYDGIKVSYAEAIKIDKAAAIDSIDRTRNIPVPISLKGKIAGLTYFFLNLTRHWVTPFNKYFNLTTYDLNPLVKDGEMSGGELMLRNLWNDTTITGASINNGDIIITGKINVFGDKVMGMATATICSDDDFGFYEELKSRLDNIADDISELMGKSEIVLDASQMMFSFPEEKDGEKMTTDQLAELMLEKLSDKGVVILDAGMDSIPQKASSTGIGIKSPDSLLEVSKASDVKENKSPIDSENIPVAEESTLPNAKQTETSKDPLGGGTLAAESDFPDLDADDPTPLGSAIPKGQDGGDLSQYEHSEHMGTESEAGENDLIDTEEEPEKWAE